ncbi:MAG: glycosyltransferase family 2 protein, partial [Flavobacterium sp.]
MNPKFSIVVPIFNVEEYIVECLESIVEQTFDDFEVILVDDCSTDNSIQIIEQAGCLSDKRFSLIRNRINGGLSVARNEGLLLAKGEYVLFLDSDDKIAPVTLQKCFDVIEKFNPDIVVFDFILFYPDRTTKERNDNLRSELTGQELAIATIKNSVLVAALNKVFRRELIISTNFKFPIGLWFEDVSTIKLFAKANSVYKINEGLYLYRQRSGSITKTFSLKLLDRYTAYRDVYKELSHVSYEGVYEKYFLIFFIRMFFFQTINNAFLQAKLEDEEEVNEIIAYIEKLPETEILKKEYLNMDLSFVEKVLLKIYFFSPKIYRNLY